MSAPPISSATTSPALDVVLASFSANLAFQHIPARVRDTALHSIVDCMGVALAGTRSEAWRQANAGLAPGQGCATVLGQSFRRSPGDAAFLNGVAAHAYDFDDTCFAGIVHASAVVWPAALAAAQSRASCSGAELVTSFVAGVETASRLGLILGDGMYARGHWNTGVLGVVGAAVAVSRILGMCPEGTTHALRLALNFPIGTRAILGSSSKPWLCGAASRAGLEAAYAARAGVRCPPQMLDGRFGFSEVINRGSLAPEALRGSDDRYCLEDPGVAFKRYPMCSAGQAGVQAALALREAGGFAPDDIAAVTCHATELVCTSLRYARPESLAQAQFSMPYAVACALVFGGFGIAELEGDTREHPQLRALMEKVWLLRTDSLVHHEDRMRYPEATRVVIRLHDGREFEHTVLAARGMPADPVTSQELEEKFMACALPVLGSAQAQRLLQSLAGLPSLATLEAIDVDGGACR